MASPDYYCIQFKQFQTSCPCQESMTQHFTMRSKERQEQRRAARSIKLLEFWVHIQQPKTQTGWSRALILFTKTDHLTFVSDRLYG